MNDISSAVGWTIRLGRHLKEGQEFDDDRLERVRSKLPGVEPKTLYSIHYSVICSRKGLFVEYYRLQGISELLHLETSAHASDNCTLQFYIRFKVVW